MDATLTTADDTINVLKLSQETNMCATVGSRGPVSDQRHPRQYLTSLIERLLTLIQQSGCEGAGEQQADVEGGDELCRISTVSLVN